MMFVFSASRCRGERGERCIFQRFQSDASMEEEQEQAPQQQSLRGKVKLSCEQAGGPPSIANHDALATTLWAKNLGNHMIFTSMDLFELKRVNLSHSLSVQLSPRGSIRL